MEPYRPTHPLSGVREGTSYAWGLTPPEMYARTRTTGSLPLVGIVSDFTSGVKLIGYGVLDGNIQGPPNTFSYHNIYRVLYIYAQNSIGATVV